jgi:hypothetical protein
VLLLVARGARGRTGGGGTVWGGEAAARCGAVLTVKFRQPSHEFTFGVGMNSIYYPLVLPPWCNKFIRACRFWSLVFMQDFSVESKASGNSSLSTS